MFRVLMRWSGREFFASEANLNLLTGSELTRAARSIVGFEISLLSVPLAGWPSNLLLVMRRSAAPDIAT
jgi:hypothetical protein